MSTDKYIRQMALPQVGESGLQRLKEASVLVVGAGGLGNAVLPYLAASGIGTIGIIDGDKISFSNLHRQVLFNESDVGLHKTQVASQKLKTQFTDISIISYPEFLNGDNALDLFKTYDLIVDATDAIDIRYLINDACVLNNKTFIHASVYRFQFQVATFNFNESGTYRCLYPNPPKTVQSCAEAGVMPTTVALAGLYQANEVLKFFLNVGELITNKILLIDTLRNQQNEFKYSTKAYNFITESFFAEKYEPNTVELISYDDIIESEVQFLDVREPEESPNLKRSRVINIPVNKLESQLDAVNKNQPVYIFCQSGKRSALAYKILKQHKFENAFCLKENADQLNKLIQ